MSARIAALIVLLPLAIGTPSPASLSPQEKAEGFRPLFNGRNLDGWAVMGEQAWTVRDGIIACSGEGHGWLRSLKEYKDFILRLEFKISKKGNSGIFVRASLDGNPAFSGMEIQILDDSGEPPSKHSTGALYDAVQPAVNTSKPAGEWNQIEIACIGRRMKVTLNGQRLYAVNLDDRELNAGLAEDRKLTNRVPSGFIGLQNHGSPVEFRNIRIKNMDVSSVRIPR